MVLTLKKLLKLRVYIIMLLDFHLYLVWLLLTEFSHAPRAFLISCKIHLDLSQTADLVVATKSTLQEFRSNAYGEKLFQYTESIAEVHNIEVQPLSETRQRRLPKRFEDCIVLEATGSCDDLCCSNSYKTKFYFPVIDTFLSEISRRFDEKNINSMHAI